jgi:AcrR family transcriptional regulator
MAKAASATDSRTRRQVNRLPPEKRIADIMQAAREVFTERGYADALISEIAERAGVVEGSIYRFFTNKHDLLVRVVETWYESMLQRDAEQFAATRGTWNQIRYIVHHHLASIRREPALSRLVFQELRPDPSYRKTRLFQLNQAYTHRIIDVVRAAMASGEFRADASPSLVRALLYGSIEHVTWAYLRKEGDFDLVATTDGITDMIYRSLVVAPTPGREPLSEAVARLERIADRLDAHVGPADTQTSK